MKRAIRKIKKKREVAFETSHSKTGTRGKHSASKKRAAQQLEKEIKVRKQVEKKAAKLKARQEKKAAPAAQIKRYQNMRAAHREEMVRRTN